MNKNKIMIFDDNYATFKVLQDILEQENYVVQSQDKNKDAVKQIEQFAPDIVIVDMLNSLSGFGIIRKIREQQTLKKLPVIAVSIDSLKRKEAFEAGADCFIGKPFGLDDLYSPLFSLAHRRASDNC